MVITEDQLKNSCPGITKKNIDKYLPWLQTILPQYEIDTPLRLQHFIAQVGHESGSFLYYRELASGEAYDTGKLAKNLGNTPEADGDGQKYRGRGCIQVTGKSNYEACSEFLFGDDRLLETPEILELPENGVKAACWFWTYKGLNKLADTDNFNLITKRINGGTNGIDDRFKRLKLAKKYIA